MITVLASWLVLFLGLCGVGALALSLLVRLTGGGAPGRQDLFRLFWLGVGATIAAAQLWNLLAPLGAGALAAWLLAAAGGLALLLPRLRAPPGAPARRRPASRLAVWALLVAAGLFLLYLGAAGVATPRWSRAYDTDLYHFSVLRWMNTYAAVPGLGNLHSRLAHTSGFLVLAALFDNLWWNRATAWPLLTMSVPLAPRRPASWRGVGRAGPRQTTTVTIANGQVPPLVVHVPSRGDRCGDAPLPATPYPLPTLLQREPGRLQAGFRRAP